MWDWIRQLKDTYLVLFLFFQMYSQFISNLCWIQAEILHPHDWRQPPCWITSCFTGDNNNLLYYTKDNRSNQLISFAILKWNLIYYICIGIVMISYFQLVGCGCMITVCLYKPQSESILSRFIKTWPFLNANWIRYRAQVRDFISLWNL
jgi:hypothetical protein